MRKRTSLIAMFSLLTSMAVTLGCSSTPSPKARTFDATDTDRNNGYALLYILVGKNQDVDKILTIKSTTPATAATVKDIAKLCKDAKIKLDEFAKEDPTLGMAAHGLPKYEQQTREAIESTTTKRLLFVSGDTFEVRLLQTQAQSTDYMAHLALMLAENEKNETRATYLKQLSKQAEVYYNQSMERLTVNRGSDPKGTAKPE